jgi:acyl carrier protein
VPSARFFDDLGGESIDVLDLSFRCEKQFGVKVSFSDFGRPEDLELDAAGALTPAALDRIEQRYPFLRVDPIRDNPAQARLSELLTVEAITEFVRRAIDGGGVVDGTSR